MNSYDRDKLYKQVWERPVSSVAKEYGVSDTAIAKACRRLCVPLPPRGYWAKVHAGQSPEIPALPEYASSEKATYKPAIDESASFSKEHHHPSAQKKVAKPVYNDDALKKQVNAFLHCCMIEEKDLVYHFKFLISCLDDEDYDHYSPQYKNKKAKFLSKCIEKIKASHLPKLTAPWVCYECEESSSGFRISIQQITKMHVSDNEIDGSETKILGLIMELKYDLLSVSEFSALHNIKESTVSRWLSTGKLNNAVFQNETWLIPEFHQKPDPEDQPLSLWLPSDNPVNIPGFPLLDYSERIWIEPNGKKYLLKYYNSKDEWNGFMLISKEDKNYLVVELLKLGISDTCAVFRAPFYPRKKDFSIDKKSWALCPSTDD